MDWFFFGSLLFVANVGATPACQDINGIRYCNTDFWIGADNLVGATSVSSLPSGEVTIVERNICSSSYHGGSLYRIEQYLQWYTGATSVNGEIWGQHPATPPSIREVTGQTINTYGPLFPEFGRTVTFKNIFTPAMYVYYMICSYTLCTEEGPNVDQCQWNSPGYLIGINIGNTPAADLALVSISIPGAKTNVNDGFPIIQVGVPTQINVPVSINFVGALPSNILNSSVPVTLQVGSYSSTQNISIASLVANQNQALVSFLVTFQSSEVGLKTLVASVNAGRSISESNYTNNEAQLNVRVGDGYTLSISALDLEELDPEKPTPCNDEDTQSDETLCKSGSITDESILYIPFGAHLNFELRNKTNQTIPAAYELSGSFVSPDIPGSTKTPPEKNDPEKGSLYDDRIALLFTQDNEKNSQSFITVHLGTQKLKITPVDTRMDSITVILKSVPTKIGDSQNTYDSFINRRAHKIGVPPSYIKGQIQKESNFNETAFRYEPISFDKKLIQNDKQKFIFGKRYKQYSFFDESNVPVNSSKKPVGILFPRFEHKIDFNGVIKNFTANDYEETVGLSRKPAEEYVPIKAGDVIIPNDKKYNWQKVAGTEYDNSEIKSEFNFVAQTATASSYGMYQVMYTTAVDVAGYNTKVNGVIIGKSPIGLFDPQTSIDVGGRYLRKCISRANTKLCAAPNSNCVLIESVSNVSDLEYVIQFGYALYNAGFNAKIVRDPDKGKVYRETAVNFSKDYKIKLNHNVFTEGSGK